MGSTPSTNRGEWIAKLRSGDRRFRDCPPVLQNDYEVMFAACSSNDRALAAQALQMAGGINVHWANDEWLRSAAGIADEPNLIMYDICISKKFAMHDKASPFSLHVVRQMRAHPSFERCMMYNPDFFNKDFCALCKDGRIDWGRVTDPSHPCRGGTCDEKKCNRPVLSASGRPTTGSCWRYSYNHHIFRVKSNNGFFLQIVEYVNDQLQLGAGQIIEEEMATDAGIPILRIEQADIKEEQEGVPEDTIKDLAHRYDTKNWDMGFAAKQRNAAKAKATLSDAEEKFEIAKKTFSNAETELAAAKKAHKEATRAFSQAYNARDVLGDKEKLFGGSSSLVGAFSIALVVVFAAIAITVWFDKGFVKLSGEGYCRPFLPIDGSKKVEALSECQLLCEVNDCAAFSMASGICFWSFTATPTYTSGHPGDVCYVRWVRLIMFIAVAFLVLGIERTVPRQLGIYIKVFQFGFVGYDVLVRKDLFPLLSFPFSSEAAANQTAEELRRPQNGADEVSAAAVSPHISFLLMVIVAIVTVSKILQRFCDPQSPVFILFVWGVYSIVKRHDYGDSVFSEHFAVPWLASFWYICNSRWRRKSENKKAD